MELQQRLWLYLKNISLTRPFSPSCLFFLQQPTWRFWGEEKVEGGAIYTVYLKKVRYHTPSKSITSGLFTYTFLSLFLFHILLLQANETKETLIYKKVAFCELSMHKILYPFNIPWSKRSLNGRKEPLQGTFWKRAMSSLIRGFYKIFVFNPEKREKCSIVVFPSESEDDISHLEWETVRVRFIKAGSLEKLVESLASDTGELESTYISVFLATYRTFASPKQVLNLLIER